MPNLTVAQKYINAFFEIWVRVFEKFMLLTCFRQFEIPQIEFTVLSMVVLCGDKSACAVTYRALKLYIL